MSDKLIDVEWWTKDGDELASSAYTLCSRIRRRQEYRRQQFLVFASMYGGVQLANFGMLSYSQQPSWLGTQLSVNVVRSVIDSCVASVAAKSRPRPAFLTSDNWRMKRKAAKLETLVDGTMEKGKYYRLLPLQFRDGCISGTGSVKVFARNGAPAYERVMPGELTVDDSESQHGDPLTMFQHKPYDRTVLARLYPDFEEKIKASKRDDLEALQYGMDSTANQVLVYEAWRLPSEDGADDGKHAIFLPGVLLSEESEMEWKWNRFPFSHYKYNPPQVGWYGEGLAQEIAGIQLEINDILDELVEQCHGVKGKWLVEQNSEVNPDHLNDEALAIVHWSGVKPEYITPSAIPQDIYQHLWKLVQTAYEIAGKSQLAATSQKPAGLNSGEAQRAYAETGAERFLHKYQMLEDTVCDTADLTLRVLRDIASDEGAKSKLTVRWGDSLREIDLKDVDLEEAEYQIQIQAASQLPSTLSGQIDTIQELAKTGIFTPDELLEFTAIGPDVKAIAKERNATRDFVEHAFDAMLDDEEFHPCEPEMDLGVALKVALAIYIRERQRGVTGDIADTMLRWISQCRDLMTKAQPPAPPPPPPNSPNGAPLAPVASGMMQ